MLIYDAFYALDTSVLWCSLHSMEYFALENEVKSAKFLKKILFLLNLMLRQNPVLKN